MGGDAVISMRGTGEVAYGASGGRSRRLRNGRNAVVGGFIATVMIVQEVFDRFLLVIGRHRPPGAAQGNSRPSKILIARADAIGDMVLFFPVLATLRRHFQTSTLVLVCREEIAALARSTGLADEVWPLNMHTFRRSAGYRTAWWNRIRRAGFELALNPVPSKTGQLLDCLIGWSYAARRVGFASTDGSARSRRRAWYNELIRVAPRVEFEGDKYEALCASLGLPAYRWSPGFCVRDIDRDDVLRRFDIAGNGAHAVIMPGAQSPDRRWAPEDFAEAVRLVGAGFDGTWLVCGSSAEQSVCGDLARRIAATGEQCVDLSGRTSLQELAVICRAGKFFLGNESAGAHIAAAQGIPVVCVMGGGHYGRFFPYPGVVRIRAVHETLPCYGCGWRCIFDFPLCISSVRPRQVADAVKEILRWQAEEARNLPNS